VPRVAPQYVEDNGVRSAALKYKWSADIGGAFYAAEDENPRLYKAVDAANFKAKMSLGIAIAEWGVWRFDGHADINDARLRLDAAWASAIDVLYAKDLRVELTDEVHESGDRIRGPLELCLDGLGDTYAHFSTASIYLAEPITKQTKLVRHLAPQKPAFDAWLSDSLRRSTEVFPRNAKYDRKTETYDSSHEPPVPREFFEAGFAYSEGASKAALRAFLKTLDPDTNPYLRTSDEMVALGFKGTPYSL
jgi:hypothetical protein